MTPPFSLHGLPPDRAAAFPYHTASLYNPLPTPFALHYARSKIDGSTAARGRHFSSSRDLLSNGICTTFRRSACLKTAHSRARGGIVKSSMLPNIVLSKYGTKDVCSEGQET